jgi:predicted PhzF superfamily epimerase YddE/YHI9
MPTFALVDAFTSQAFAGNPAGVVLLDGPVDPAWAQRVAAEVGASETAFVRPADDGTFDLRWWTPAAEVDLCGHATLAAAHVLIGHDPQAPGDVVRFATRSGLLTVTRRPPLDPDRPPMLVMDLPVWAPVPRPAPAPLAAALGEVPHRYHGRNSQDQVFDLVEVDDVPTLLGLRVDLEAVTALGGTGLIVTTAGDGGADIASRVFAPAVGVDEDPVTGSAHAVLGPWWSARLGRDRLVADQRSARGGRLELHVTDDHVAVAGQAVTVIRGMLLV